MKRMFLVALVTAFLLFSAVPAHALCLVEGTDYQVGAEAAVVMEAASGRLLFSQNPHKQLPIASTTKIITALITLEQEDLHEPFAVDEKAILAEGSSMGLQPGDTATLWDLAGGMLMASGNDAAQAAAVHISGSIEEFMALVNRRAAAIGMNNSHFSTPSGLDADDHYSTAYDLALLGREALKNPTFAAMCASPRLTLNYGNPPYDRTLANHNRLISRYEGAIGIKTGFTKKSGRCLVSAATRGRVTLICVTLDCGDDWDTHEDLYDRYFPMVTMEALPPPAEILIPVTGGTMENVSLTPTQEVLWPQVKGWPQTVTTKVFAPNFLYAPVLGGDIVGKMVYYIEDQAVGETPLAVSQEVPRRFAPKEKGWWDRFIDFFD